MDHFIESNVEEEHFTEDELQSAKSYLLRRMTEFWEDSDIGYELRQRAIETFKKKNKLKSNCELEIVKITADLANNTEMSNAVDMNLNRSYHNE